MILCERIDLLNKNDRHLTHIAPLNQVQDAKKSERRLRIRQLAERRLRRRARPEQRFALFGTPQGHPQPHTTPLQNPQ